MIEMTKNGDLGLENRFKLLEQWMNGGVVEDLVDMAYDQFMKSFPNTTGAKGGRQTDASKGGWAPRKLKYNYPTLNKTGGLKRSYKKRTYKRSGKVYTNNKIAGYHDAGHTRGWYPSREVIGPSRTLQMRSKRYIKYALNTIFSGFPRTPRYNSATKY